MCVSMSKAPPALNSASCSFFFEYVFFSPPFCLHTLPPSPLSLSDRRSPRPLPQFLTCMAFLWFCGPATSSRECLLSLFFSLYYPFVMAFVVLWFLNGAFFFPLSRASCDYMNARTSTSTRLNSMRLQARWRRRLLFWP